MSILEAIILGVIQGLTEFLPVSSSGHIELGKAVLNVELNDPLLFSIVVHAATALSTIVIFRMDIWMLIRMFFEPRLWNAGRQYILYIAISMIPTLVHQAFLCVLVLRKVWTRYLKFAQNVYLLCIGICRNLAELSSFCFE